MQIKYGNFETIPITQVLARTKKRLQLGDITDYDPDILLYINEAAASLGTKPTFIKKNCCLEIDCGRVTLPKGLKRIIGVKPIVDDPITNINSLALNGVCEPLIYMERAFISPCQQEFGTACRFQNIDGIFERQGNQLIFPIPSYYTHVILAYDGFATTEDGILELRPQYERGLSEYSVAMMLRSYPQLLSQDVGNRDAEIQRANADWVTQRTWLVSNAFADDWTQNHYIIKRVLHGLLQQQNIIINE